MISIYIAIAIIAILLCVLSSYLYLKMSKKYKLYYNQFKDVIDIEEERQKLEKQMQRETSAIEKKLKDFDLQEKELKQDYQKKRGIFDNLQKEINILEEDLEFISFGVYKPHFDFETSEKYKEQLTKIRQLQKVQIKNKAAAVCHTEWEVGGSKREGKKMTNRLIKLVLRAFNGECDSAMLKVKWNNVLKMEQRIKKAFEAINKLCEPNNIKIAGEYLQLKLDELRLSHEYQEQLYEEKEEQRMIREQIREEEKVQREIEKAQREVEQEEVRYEKALEQAKKNLETAQGEEIGKLNDQMKDLEQKLKEAHEMKERTKSRAELTKSGHVYIISNLGSFGENVYKIGMTRRLEPLDRVKELGDASVPFGFDVHAMVFSENAPELENKLHHSFNTKRLNLVNKRREFFNVTLGEIEKAVHETHGEIEFTKLAEARDFRESVSIRDQQKLEAQRQAEIDQKFPASL